MKNVSHDYELENDNVESVEESNPSPQFQFNEAPVKRRRVEYDEKGRVRKDQSTKYFKIAGLAIVIILVNLYALHNCAPMLFGI